MDMWIEYEGLRFERLSEGHAEAILAAVEVSGEKLKRYMDWAHVPSSVEAQHERAREVEENGLFEFVLLEGGEFVMTAGLRPSKTMNKHGMSIGYWTSTPYCGRGFATLATQMLIVVAFDYFGCDRVEIDCNRENVASRRVIEKCGFTFEGVVRNFFTPPTEEMLQNGYTEERSARLYSMLRDELEQQPWYPSVKDKTTVHS